MWLGLVYLRGSRKQQAQRVGESISLIELGPGVLNLNAGFTRPSIIRNRPSIAIPAIIREAISGSLRLGLPRQIHGI